MGAMHGGLAKQPFATCQWLMVGKHAFDSCRMDLQLLLVGSL
jgi:hypothetical protein